MNPNGNDEIPCAAQNMMAVMDLPEGIVAIGCKDMVIRNVRYFDSTKNAI